MAWLVTGVPQPLWNHIERNTNHRGLESYSALLDPVWLSANMKYVKEMESFRKSLEEANKTRRPNAPEVDHRSAAAKARARRKEEAAAKEKEKA